MDVSILLGIFIQWPWLALVPGCAFALAWYRCRRAGILVAALAWLAYFAYELGISLRILCTGECNIRVDLLVFYPLLLALSVWAVVTILRASGRR